MQRKLRRYVANSYKIISCKVYVCFSSERTADVEKNTQFTGYEVFFVCLFVFRMFWPLDLVHFVFEICSIFFHLVLLFWNQILICCGETPR